MQILIHLILDKNIKFAYYIISCSTASASHINESFHAVNYSIKPSLQYKQLKLCAKQQKSIISVRTGSYDSSKAKVNFAYYSIL